MKQEPVAVIGGLTQVIAAVIALLLGFGVVDWTQEQTGLVLAVWAAISAFVLIFWVRSKVTPVE